MAATLQQQARALGDVTRHNIFRYVADSDTPVDIVELTGQFGLHHNAIRQHLAKLLAAGLVVESTVATGAPGRPRLSYRIDATAESRWGVVGPYERLSLLLTEVTRTGDTPVEVGRRAGRRRRLGGAPVEQPVMVLADQMARHGFDPTVKTCGDEVTIVLRVCPFATAALVDADTVCGLHLGIAYGLTDQLGGVAIDELVPRDPRHAQCVLRAHLTSDH
jgi:predicted ArsR family transcriptional regulator